MSGGATAGDPRFFARTGPHGLAAIAEAAAGRIARPAAGDSPIAGLAPLGAAGPEHIGYVDSRRHAAALRATRAGAVLIPAGLESEAPAATVPIVCANPAAAWAKVAVLFHPLPPLRPGAHASAVIDPEARIDASAEVGPLAVIGAGAEIGPRCRIGSHAVVGDGVVMGADCRIGAGASVSHALLGARVLLHPGARIGQEGFGLAETESGMLTMPQLGRVVIEDDVEVGANSTIDRGALADTVIGAGSRLDNLVQIGHNVRLGRYCVIVAQVGISGSTVLDDFVVVAGQAGFAGHLTIGTRARIGAQAGVIRDVAPGTDMLGSPAMPARAFFRQVAWLRRMALGRGDKGETKEPGR